MYFNNGYPTVLSTFIDQSTLSEKNVFGRKYPTVTKKKIYMYSGTLVFLKFNLKDKKQNVLLQNCAEGEACDEAAAAAAEGNPCRSDLGFTMIMTMMIIRVTYLSQIPALFMLSFKI